MLEFFRGWKRKIGVLTLLLASVLVGGWVRSLSTYEFLTAYQKVNNESWCVTVGSLRGEITVTYPWATVWGPPFPLYQKYAASEGVDGRGWIQISYWSIVIPLTLLSPSLLLSKPRAKKLPTQTES